MKKIITVIVVFVGIYIGFVYQSRLKQRILADKVRNEQIARENIIEAATRNLADKHHAVTDWTKRLNNSSIDQEDLKAGDLSMCYSFEIENALTQSNSPILLETELRDILRKGNTHYAVFSIIGFTGIRFELEISPAQIASLLLKPRPIARYAVVATIKSAYRPAIEIAKLEQSETYDEIKVETESDFIIAKGKLLDYVCLEKF
jgi:hypothetical protein